MKRWYVAQVLTGTEATVRDSLKVRVVEEGLEDRFGRIVVPESSPSNIAEGEEKEKIFPGYVLVEMEMDGDTRKLVLDTNKVHKFLGGDSPTPLSGSEVERIFEQISGKIKVKKDGGSFSVGGEVHIASGPFEGFVGIIEELDEEREKMKVMVSIFGRMTAIELGFDQVKR